MDKKQKKGSSKDTIDKIVKRAVQKIRKVFPNMNPHLCCMYMEHMIPLLVNKDEQYDTHTIESNLNKFIDKRLYKFNNIIDDYTKEIKIQLSNCPCGR